MIEYHREVAHPFNSSIPQPVKTLKRNCKGLREFWLNRHSKYDAILYSQILFSAYFFLQFCRLGGLLANLWSMVSLTLFIYNFLEFQQMIHLTAHPVEGVFHQKGIKKIWMLQRISWRANRQGFFGITTTQLCFYSLSQMLPSLLWSTQCIYDS